MEHPWRKGKNKNKNKKRNKTNTFSLLSHCCIPTLATLAKKASYSLDFSIYSVWPSVFYIINYVNRIFKLLETVFKILQREKEKKAAAYLKNINAT